MKKYLFAVAGAAAMGVCAPAQAVVLASFSLPANPSPDDWGIGSGFVVWDVGGFPDFTLGVADIFFFNADLDGGLEIDDFYGGSVFLATDGPQLYTGDEDAPTMLLGTFNLTEYLGSTPYLLEVTESTPGIYSYVISTVDAVPEPASWAMMIAGFGLVGAAMRRRDMAVAFG